MTKAGFFTRMANEATRTLSDAYGHVMHGDDAGSSAKVVWVVHPTNVPIHSGDDDNNNGGGGKKEEKNNNNKKKGNPQSPSSNKNNSSNNNSGDGYLYTQKFGKLHVMLFVYCKKMNVCNLFFCMAYNHLLLVPTITHNKYTITITQQINN